MPTTITITGTGTPLLVPGRAGPGVNVRWDDVSLQFDAGRATSLRLVEAGEHPGHLTALFVTHHHSDHLTGLTALLTDRWLEAAADEPPQPLVVVAPEGPAADIVERTMDVWTEEVAMRAAHTGRLGTPAPEVRRFVATSEPAEVFTAGRVRVSAVAVRHEPVVPAVAYRVETPDGVVAISGDTAVCPEIEAVSHRADVVVHEAFRPSAAAGVVSDPANLAAYHADTIELGEMADRADVGTLVLTHLIPPPRTQEEEEAFVTDVRTGGFAGEVAVARDLTALTLVESRITKLVAGSL